MSLKPFSACVVPERTASVARAAFPAGSLCIRIFDEVGTIFQDQDFADLYSGIAYFAESKPVNAMTLFRMLFMAAAAAAIAISLFFVRVFAQPREDPGLTLG